MAPTAKSELTRRRIRGAAVSLFNERGVSAVTTHAVARAARLSPGNLYYHYRDKRAIVRDVFRDIAIYRRDAWRAVDGDFAAFLSFYFGSVIEHRFFFRDFSALLRDDRALASQWRRAWSEVLEDMRAMLRRWVAEGLILPFEGKAGEDAFLDNAWVLSHFSAVYAEARRGAAPDAGREVSGLAAFLAPYHTAKGRRELERWLKERA